MSEYLDNLLASAYETVTYTDAELYESFLAMFRMPIQSLSEIVANPKGFESHISFLERLYKLEPDTLFNMDLRSAMVLMRDDDYCAKACSDTTEEWSIYRCQFLIQAFTSICKADPVLMQLVSMPVEQFYQFLLTMAENEPFRNNISEYYGHVKSVLQDVIQVPPDMSFYQLVNKIYTSLYDCSYFHRALKMVLVINFFFFDLLLRHLKHVEHKTPLQIIPMIAEGRKWY